MGRRQMGHYQAGLPTARRHLRGRLPRHALDLHSRVGQRQAPLATDCEALPRLQGSAPCGGRLTPGADSSPRRSSTTRCPRARGCWSEGTRPPATTRSRHWLFGARGRRGGGLRRFMRDAVSRRARSTLRRCSSTCRRAPTSCRRRSSARSCAWCAWPTAAAPPPTTTRPSGSPTTLRSRAARLRSRRRARRLGGAGEG